MARKNQPLNFFWVEQGDKVGVECELCGDRFFDILSARKRSRVAVSALDKVVNHGKSYHPQHPPGRIAMREEATGKAELQRSRGLRTVAKPGDPDYAQERT